MTAAAPRPLARGMKTTGALLLTLSAVTPAASVYVIVPGVIQQAGTGAFISLAAAAVVALAMAFVYAELASAFPIAGGEYAMIGRTLGPAAGFVFMGMNAAGSTLAPAVLSLGAAEYLSAIWPDAPARPIAIVMIAGATVFGILNIRLNAWVTGLFLAVEVGALIVLASLGFAHIHRPLTDLILHPVMLAPSGLKAPPSTMIGLATAVSIFAYNGFGAAVYFAEETRDAPRRVPRAILLALALTVGFEFIPVTAVLLGAPDMRALLAARNPFSAFVNEVGGAGLGRLISLGVALAIANAVLAIVLTMARFYYSSGRDRAWPRPVNAALTSVHERFQSPWVATLVAGGAGAAACFIPFHLLLVMNGTGVVAIYALLCLAVIAGRRTGATAHGAWRMPLYPVAPILGLATLVYVLYANWLDPDVGRPSLVATMATIVLAAIYYLVMRRRRGAGWAMVGPADVTPEPRAEPKAVEGVRKSRLPQALRRPPSR